MSTSDAQTSIDRWLEKLGLSQYSEIFRHNDITTKDVLLSLDDSDLQSMGVESLGHRKTILASIEKLRMSQSASQSSQGEVAPRGQVHERTTEGGSGVWKVVGWLVAVALVLIIAGMLGC